MGCVNFRQDLSDSDYAPFGAQLAERSFFSETYPNSFNDKRDDPELGDWQDYGMRMYSTWQRRFVTTDPLMKDFPWNSNYAFAENRVIDCIDLDGLELQQVIDLAKYILPIVPSIEYKVGSDGNEIGFSVSIGVPKVFPFSVRKDFSFRSNFGENNTVVKTETATEITAFGMYSWKTSELKYQTDNQKIGEFKLGTPLFNMSSYNDIKEMGGDGGDRWNTAGGNIQFGMLSVGFNLFTEDPGFNKVREVDWTKGPNGTYKTDSENAFRKGIIYMGFGDFKIGTNSDKNRDMTQNIIHDLFKYPRFANKKNDKLKPFVKNGNLRF